MSISFLYALLITTNSPLTLQSQTWVYATEQEEDNIQEETQTPSENEGVTDEINSESESSKGTTDSDQSESNSNRNDDASSTNQNSNCPNNPEISDVPLYIGKDGCQYPCPSLDSNDQNNIPEGCPRESSSSPQTSTDFSSKEGNPTQSPPQEQQQNGQDSTNQNAFVSPSINSDTSTAISDSEAPTTTTTQKSFTPAGKLRSGTTQTESSIPSFPNDVSKPKLPDSGNVGVEGTTLIPPSQSESSIPSPPNNPSKSFDPSKPFTPGSQTTSPVNGSKGNAFLTVKLKYFGPPQDYREPKMAFGTLYGNTFTPSIPKEAVVASSGTTFTLKAPASVIFGGSNWPINSRIADKTVCFSNIYPGDSKTCTVTVIHKDYESKIQTESSIPWLQNDPNDPSKPLIPGSHFPYIVEAFQEDVPLVIYFKFTNPKSPLIAKYCVSTYSYPPKVSQIEFNRNEEQANPYCIDADSDGTLHTVKAPGMLEIKIINTNFDTVDTSNCKRYLQYSDSYSCVLNFANK